LNRNVIFFFSKLRYVTAASTINPLTNYFSGDFVTFLSKVNQQTLRGLFTTFFDAFKVLPLNERQDVITKFTAAQKIDAQLTDDTIDCSNYYLNTLPSSLRGPARGLFEYLFSRTLNSYGKLKDHYRLIFNSLESNLCPFCGIELLNSPSIVRQDYDHLMKQSTYVFTSVNMYNLVPTGTECNRINKNSIDAVYNNLVRSVFNSPYVNHFNIQISLVGSIPPATIDGAGHWIVTIQPSNDYTRQWNHVYNIRTRYTDNILQKFYKNWLKELRTYFREKGLTPITSAAFEAELKVQATVFITHPAVGNIVRSAFYEFLIQYTDLVYRTSLLNFINS
jgi:hypothetical protein